MSKPIWMKVGSLESYEKTNSLKSLMQKFLEFCQNHKYNKGSIANIEQFATENDLGPTQKNMLQGILELRKYIKKSKLIHDVAVIRDNFEFRSNRVAYLMNKYLLKK